jgi:hypothetical protein
MEMDSLPSDLEFQACALIGSYLDAWATVEYSLNQAIGAGLNLKSEQQLSVTRNFGFVKKSNIFDDLVDAASLPMESKVKIKKSIEKLRELAQTDRNTIVQSLFFAHDDGVEFHYVNATDKPVNPKFIWSVKDFDVKRAEVIELGSKIERAATYFLTNSPKKIAATQPSGTDGKLSALGQELLDSLSEDEVPVEAQVP